MNNTRPSSADVVVVGSGLSGLAAATYVARAGRSVAVLERSSHVGGRAITQDQGGYKFNLGPHALYKEGAGAAILHELGVQINGNIPPKDGLALRGGELHILPSAPLAMLRTSLLYATEKFELVGKRQAQAGFRDMMLGLKHHVETGELIGHTLPSTVSAG